MRDDYIRIPDDLSEEENDRFKMLVAGDVQLCLLSAFMNGEPVVVVCSYHEDPNNERPYRLYPLAKLLTDTEMSMLQEPFDGKRPGPNGSETLQ